MRDARLPRSLVPYPCHLCHLWIRPSLPFIWNLRHLRNPCFRPFLPPRLTFRTDMLCLALMSRSCPVPPDHRGEDGTETKQNVSVTRDARRHAETLSRVRRPLPSMRLNALRQCLPCSTGGGGMSFPRSFASDVEGPACADALAAQRDRASRAKAARPKPLQDGQPETAAVRLAPRTTPFALFQRALLALSLSKGPVPLSQSQRVTGIPPSDKRVGVREKTSSSTATRGIPTLALSLSKGPVTLSLDGRGLR